MHPYFGKFVPQLVEYFLHRDLKNAKLVCDPFAGSGTTIVESNVMAKPSIGLDISKFNVLLCSVKTAKYDMPKLKKEVDIALHDTQKAVKSTNLDNYVSDRAGSATTTDSEYLNTWFHPEALCVLLAFREAIKSRRYQDVLKAILTRSARSSRMIAHYETDHPKEPQAKDYYCVKHDRMCHPTKNAMSFLKRYCSDTVNRIAQYQSIRKDVYTKVKHGDSSQFDFSETRISDVFTSPPYVGLVDYHEQHRYAYELLGLDDNSKAEIGSKRSGSSKRAIWNYKQGITAVFKNTAKYLPRDGTVIIVVNDKFRLYDDIVGDSGLVMKKRLCREVNRRSGRRATSFNEDILICGLDGR